MKRIVIYILVLAALLLAPVEGTDIAMLHPVEVVFLYSERGQMVIETDTGDLGKGDDVGSALGNLKKTTTGHVYLDTAEYLLIAEECLSEVERLRPELKGNVEVCKAETGIDLKEAAVFLPAHGRLPQLKAWKQGVDLPKLTCFEKRLKLSEK